MICPYDGEDCVVGYGHCHCGCGQTTNIPSRNSKKYGHVKGQPYRWRQGHQSRRLDAVMVRNIRQAYATSNITQTELAKIYSVSQMTISRILLGDQWKDVGIEEAPQ